MSKPHFLLIMLILCITTGYSQHYTTGTKEDRIKLLESINRTDKSIRSYHDSVRTATGFHSEQHLEAIDSVLMVDSLLGIKISDYLDMYGYPELEEYGETATLTPWLILHHSKNIKLKRQYYKTIYNAYEDENLSERRVIEYLEDMYILQFRKNFQSYNQNEMRIKELKNILDL